MTAIIAFDHRGRPVGKYPSIKVAADTLHVPYRTILRLVQDGKPTSDGSYTFDEALEES